MCIVGQIGSCAWLARLPAARAAELGVETGNLDRVLSEADFISLHAPLLKSTKGLINRRSLEIVKAGAIIINTPRGGLIVEADLFEALPKGR